jgi:hypothetical protein
MCKRKSMKSIDLNLLFFYLTKSKEIIHRLYSLLIQRILIDGKPNLIVLTTNVGNRFAVSVSWWTPLRVCIMISHILYQYLGEHHYVSVSWSVTFCISIQLIRQFENVKGKSEAANWRRTDRTMAKGKMIKRQTMINKALNIKLRIAQHEPH